MTTEQKIDSILASVTDIEKKVIAMEIYQKQQRKEIDQLNYTSKKLEADRNKLIGISSLIAAGIGAFVGWLLKHI